MMMMKIGDMVTITFPMLLNIMTVISSDVNADKKI